MTKQQSTMFYQLRHSLGWEGIKGRVEKAGITPALILPHPSDELGIFDKGRGGKFGG